MPARNIRLRSIEDSPIHLRTNGYVRAFQFYVRTAANVVYVFNELKSGKCSVIARAMSARGLMRAALTVVPSSPSLDLGTDVRQRPEPVRVEALVLQAPVERVHEGIFRHDGAGALFLRLVRVDSFCQSGPRGTGSTKSAGRPSHRHEL